jgi:hypothetical protein
MARLEDNLTRSLIPNLTNHPPARLRAGTSLGSGPTSVGRWGARVGPIARPWWGGCRPGAMPFHGKKQAALGDRCSATARPRIAPA